MEEKEIKSAYVKSMEGNTLVGAMGSTSDMDRDGDIVVPEGIDLKNFVKNPVILWQHNSWELPIGKAVNVSVGPEGLVFDLEFAVDANPMAKMVRDLFEGKFLNAFSIGFIVKQRDAEKITECELLEISAVNIPSNPHALASKEYQAFSKSLETMTMEKSFEKFGNNVVEAIKGITITAPAPVTETKSVVAVPAVPAPSAPQISKSAIKKQLINSLNKKISL